MPKLGARKGYRSKVGSAIKRVSSIAKKRIMKRKARTGK